MKKIYKFIIILLVSSFLLSNMQIGIFIKAMMPDVIVENKENDDVDLSLIPNIEEIEEKRTENSKTYKKENGMYETKYYKEQIHFKNEEGYQEIDNTLNLKEDKYINKDNAYHISLPKTLNKNESINITYNNEQINIYYDINNNISSNLSNKVNRNNKNLKDEISYQLNNLEIVEYIIKQNSVKENIILNEYIKGYNYSYFIETTLNLEKIDGKLLFKNKNNETIFVMNEYYMYDSNNNESTNITYDIHEVKKDLYKIIVTPSDEFLKEAVFPVTIDPEITFMNGGFTSGISNVYSVDLETDNTTYLNDGVFTINNRDKDNSNDDLIAYLEFNLISDYTVDVSSILNNNQFMYAYLTLPTYNTNVTNNTNVNLNLVDSLTDTSKILVDSESIVNNNNFNHKFNIYDTFVNKMDDLKNGSTNLLFELSLEGNSNSSITYSLYGNITGTPVVSIGYLDEAGLNDYYTYESLPMNSESSFYIAHNSGNLTYIYNTYNDKNLINLSHIYNVNRRNENSPYGKGFNINYNEKITESTMNRMILTKGDYSTIIYNETTENNYLSTDGSNSSLTKVYDENNNLIEYVIKELNGELKKYDSNGKLTKIYPNYLDENVYVTLIYDSMDRISSIKDSYNNELILTYCAFDTSDEYLFAVEVKKYDPTIEADFKYAFPTVMVFNYNNGKLTDITEDYQLYSTDDTITYIEYDTNTRINKVHKNNIGYTFLYDDFNRIEKASVYSNMYNNGNYLNFAYSKNGKKTIISNGLNDITSYTFDKYYHTISIETSDGYTTFYKYEDIYYDDEGNYILEPNYNLNHKVIVQSNAFKNVYNPVNNHGFEVITSGDIYGWTSDLSNNSTSSINTNEYLYGSKVLEIDNKINSSYVYQEIYVESGKTYIISGYIKNINTSGGAYIDVEAIGANITNVEKDNYIVNEKEFVRYECKFNTTTSGFIRIKLINPSIGKVYFDNIQLSTNYVDTRYNYLSNSSFEVTNSAWIKENAEYVTNNYFNDDCHNQSLKLDINGTISQTLNIIGKKGDTFVFGGYSFFQNYTGKIKVKLTLYNIDGTESQEFIIDDNDLNATYMMNKLTATSDYYQIKLEITNISNSSIAYIDNIALYKEGYGINVTYNEAGLVEEEHNEITDKTTTNEYDEENNLTKVTTDSTTIEYEYDNKNRLDKIKGENVTTTFEKDDKGNITSIKSNNDGNKVYDHGSSSYTPDGLFPLTSSDILGNEETKTYSYLTGLINLIVDEQGVETAYIYDKDDNLLNVTRGKDNNYKSITYTYDVNGLLTSIIVDNLTYSFTYNDYNDLKTIKINNDTILTNNYNNEDGTGVYVGELNETIYSYGTVSFDYDEEHRIKSIYYNNTKVLEYTYNDYGEIASYIDYKENVTYYYNYDYQNRLINVKTSTGNNITYTYNDKSLLTSVENKNGLDTYEYDEKDYLIEENISTNKYQIAYSYSTDSFKQLNVISYYLSNNRIDVNYTYEKNTVNGKDVYTGRIKEIEYTGINNKTIKYEYTYDSNSNITKILGYTNNVLTYEENNTYDIFNQLTRQTLTIEGISYSYNYYYDTKGNISSYYSYKNLARITSASFTYNAKNELTKAVINGDTYNITYSSTGQPNKYFNWDITYDMRSIKVIENNEYYIEYSYNASAVRTNKRIETPNKITHIEYTLNGTNIIEEKRYTNLELTETLKYYYDSSDNIIGFTYNGEKYLYLKNIQNDIIGIIDQNNNLVVEYKYDAYGNTISMIDNTNNSIGEKNPYRYRSYYYDTETTWYYLNSRYYNPNIGRFITMDEIEYLGATSSILSYNLFTYCEGNPVNRVDSLGNAWYDVVWDWCNTIAGVVNPVSTVTAVASVVSAAIDGRWNDVVDDWNNGRMNPFNKDATTAKDAKVLSFYKGSTVVKQDEFGYCSAFGTIWLNSGKDETDVMHEYGHSVQERLLGPLFWTRNAIPSVAYYWYDVKTNGSSRDYYSTPWERTADFLGGVKGNRGYGYKKGSLAWAAAESLLGPIVIPFYFVFGY